MNRQLPIRVPAATARRIPTGRPRASRPQAMTKIIQRFETRNIGSLQLADLCRVAAVRARTLRTMFLEAFGMPPNRYLRTPKLLGIRAALAMAYPAHETVASVARRFGLSDAGRMAKDYFALFGEYPRTTLFRNVVRVR